MDTNPQKRIAAYVPFRTFLTALEALEGGVPKEIDRKIWRSFSGLVQTQVLGAFRFLGLVDGGEPTPELRKLVEDKQNRPAVLRRILEQSYSALVSHDLTKMTGTMLDGLMEKYGVTGATKRKGANVFPASSQICEASPFKIPVEPDTHQSRNTPKEKDRGRRGNGQW